MATREEILSLKFETKRKLHVPQWNCDVFIKAMTAAERDMFEVDYRRLKEAGDDPLRNLRARLAAATVCDESGQLLFTQADVDQLGQHPAGALDLIADLAMELSGMQQHDAETLAAELKNARPSVL